MHYKLSKQQRKLNQTNSSANWTKQNATNCPNNITNNSITTGQTSSINKNKAAVWQNSKTCSRNHHFPAANLSELEKKAKEQIAFLLSLREKRGKKSPRLLELPKMRSLAARPTTCHKLHRKWKKTKLQQKIHKDNIPKYSIFLVSHHLHMDIIEAGQ